MNEYPTTFKDLQAELLKHSKDGRSDALFRFVIAAAQFGHLAAHLSHDQTLNPGCRPYGTRDGEASDAGHAIVQIMTYCALRDIDIEDAIHRALDNLRDKDFIAKPIGSKGFVAYPGDVCGIAWVDPYCEHLAGMPEGSILICNHPSCMITPFTSKMKGIITENGGMMSHAAIISREMSIPCIVGMSGIISKFKTGDIVRMTNGEVSDGGKIDGN